MLTLLLLFDLPTQIALFAPVILWFAGPPAWHPYIIGLTVLVLIAVFVWVRRKWRREDAARQARGLADTGCQWAPGMTVAAFSTLADRFLRLRAWNIVESRPGFAGGLMLLIRKERTRVALLCTPDTKIPREAIAAFAGFAREQAAQHAATIMNGAARAAGPIAGITPLGYADLARLDEFFAASSGYGWHGNPVSLVGGEGLKLEKSKY